MQWRMRLVQTAWMRLALWVGVFWAAQWYFCAFLTVISLILLFVFLLFPAELEVARMSTDGNLPDLKFPQTGDQSNSIHLSANTLKQHGRNGRSSAAGCSLKPWRIHYEIWKSNSQILALGWSYTQQVVSSWHASSCTPFLENCIMFKCRERI